MRTEPIAINDSERVAEELKDLFLVELEDLLMKYGWDDRSVTPAHFLAKYIHDSLKLFSDTVNARDYWLERT